MTDDYGRQIRELASQYADRTGFAPFQGVEHRGPGAPSLYLFASAGPFTNGPEALGYMRGLLFTVPPPEVLARRITRADVDDYPDYFISGDGRPIAETTGCGHGYMLTDSCPSC